VSGPNSISRSLIAHPACIGYDVKHLLRPQYDGYIQSSASGRVQRKQTTVVSGSQSLHSLGLAHDRGTIILASRVTIFMRVEEGFQQVCSTPAQTPVN
jgi:hypothetical protein